MRTEEEKKKSKTKNIATADNCSSDRKESRKQNDFSIAHSINLWLDRIRRYGQNRFQLDQSLYH